MHFSTMHFNTMHFKDILYVSDGKMRRADIVVEGDYISRITDKEEVSSFNFHLSTFNFQLLLPGIIDDHVHTREPGLTHKGDLATETHAAAAGGVTSIMDMPNVVPQTTTLETLVDRQQRAADHAFVNYAFHFGVTNSNLDQIPQLDPTAVPALKLFMGSSTGNMLVDREDVLDALFAQPSPLPIMAHCEDTSIIQRNMQRAVEQYGDDPEVRHHSEIRSREACFASSRRAVQLSQKHHRRLHIAHISTVEELELIDKGRWAMDNERSTSYYSQFTVDNSSSARRANSGEQLAPQSALVSVGFPDGEPVTLEACLPHLLFCDEDYARLGTRIKCNPAVKTAADRAALRAALRDGRISVIATDHAPHLLTEKQGGCRRAASGIPMVQFSLVAMLELMEQGVITLPEMVQLMCHNPARIFGIRNRGYIREGMKADLVLVKRKPWQLAARDIVSPCGWSPLEGQTFHWQVAQTYCNGRLIYNKGVFADGNRHAQALRFRV